MTHGNFTKTIKFREQSTTIKLSHLKGSTDLMKKSQTRSLKLRLLVLAFATLQLWELGKVTQPCISHLILLRVLISSPGKCGKPSIVNQVPSGTKQLQFYDFKGRNFQKEVTIYLLSSRNHNKQTVIHTLQYKFPV